MNNVIPTKVGRQLMCSRRISSSCTTSDTRIVYEDKSIHIMKRMFKNSDGQQVHQYKKNTFHLKSLNTKKTRTHGDRQISLFCFGTYTIIMYEVHVMYYSMSLNNDKCPFPVPQICVLTWLWLFIFISLTFLLDSI